MMERMMLVAMKMAMHSLGNTNMPVLSSQWAASLCWELPCNRSIRSLGGKKSLEANKALTPTRYQVQKEETIRADDK